VKARQQDSSQEYREMEKIDWTKYVDEVCVISYVKNAEKRKRLARELERVGIEKYEIRYSVDNKILDHLASDYNTNDILPYHRYVTNTHYECIKEKHDLGCKSLLVLEDDVIFLKDLAKIKTELDRMLEANADIAMLDYIEYDTSYVGEWARLYQLSSAYRLNRLGMEYIYKRIEKQFATIDAYFGNCALQWDNGKRILDAYNPIVGHDVTFSTPIENRICLQSKDYEDGLHYDYGIYYESNVSNPNRVDPVITEEIALEKYNFIEYMQRDVEHN